MSRNSRAKFHYLVLPIIYIILNSCIYEYPEDILLESSNWELVWEENFDKPYLDTNIWSYAPRGRASWAKYMSENDSCYRLDNSTLTLLGIVNNFDTEDPSPYFTGGIISKNKKHFDYGRIEIRAKMNKIDGAWPALWMLCVDRSELGELDIMESYDKEDVIHQTAHSIYSLDTKNAIKYHGVNVINDKSEFNNYGVVIEENYVIFYVNNSVTHIINKSEPYIEGQFPYDDEKFLLLTMQLDHEKAKVDPADLPAELTIDWIRYYTKIDKNIPDF